jgi:hypothetical protein
MTFMRIPQVSAKRNFLEVSGEIVERVDPVFFSDPMTAAMKALGMRGVIYRKSGARNKTIRLRLRAAANSCTFAETSIS